MSVTEGTGHVGNTFRPERGAVEESMPWKETDVLEERTRFVLDHDSEQYTMAELCRMYGVARKTGYQWVKRYEAEGLGGLADRRYGAGNHPNQTEALIEEQILQLKYAYPSWGAKKLRGCLAGIEHFWRDFAAKRVNDPAAQAAAGACVQPAVSKSGGG